MSLFNVHVCFWSGVSTSALTPSFVYNHVNNLGNMCHWGWSYPLIDISVLVFVIAVHNHLCNSECALGYSVHPCPVSSARLSAFLTRNLAREIMTSGSFVWPLSSLLPSCLPCGIFFYEMFHFYSQALEHVRSSEGNTLHQLRNLQCSYLDLSLSCFYRFICVWVSLCLLW